MTRHLVEETVQVAALEQRQEKTSSRLHLGGLAQHETVLGTSDGFALIAVLCFRELASVHNLQSFGIGNATEGRRHPDDWPYAINVRSERVSPLRGNLPYLWCSPCIHSARLPPKIPMYISTAPDNLQISGPGTRLRGEKKARRMARASWKPTRQRAAVPASTQKLGTASMTSVGAKTDILTRFKVVYHLKESFTTAQTHRRGSISCCLWPHTVPQCGAWVTIPQQLEIVLDCFFANKDIVQAISDFAKNANANASDTFTFTAPWPNTVILRLAPGPVILFLQLFSGISS